MHRNRDMDQLSTWLHRNYRGLAKYFHLVPLTNMMPARKKKKKKVQKIQFEVVAINYRVICNRKFEF